MLLRAALAADGAKTGNVPQADKVAGAIAAEGLPARKE